MEAITCLWTYKIQHPFRQILDSSKPKEFSNDSSKVVENGGEFAELVENTVGKEENARNEQFLLFPHCFQKPNTADTYTPGLVWARVNLFGFRHV